MTKRNISQTSLELAVVFASITLFFIGVTRIWVWSNAQMVGRAPAYDDTRLAAGSSHPGFWGEQYLGDQRPGVYTPRELTEDAVFSGDFSGSGGTATAPGSETRLAGFYGDGYTEEALAGGSGGGSHPVFGFHIDPSAYVPDIMNCDTIAEAIAALEAEKQRAEEQKPVVEEEMRKWQTHMNTADYHMVRLQNEIAALSAGGGITCQTVTTYCKFCPGACYTCTSLGGGGGGWGGCGDLTPLYACRDRIISALTNGAMWMPWVCQSGEDCTTGCSSTIGCINSCTVSGDCGGRSANCGYSSRDAMADDYYYWYLATEGFTNHTARYYFYGSEPEYKCHDSPYAGYACGCYMGTCNYLNYEPGLLDWEARFRYAEVEYNQMRDALQDIDDAIQEIDDTIAMLEEEAAALGC